MVLASPEWIVIIDAGQYHFSDPFTGNRCLIIAYNHVCADELSQVHKSFFSSLGFRLSKLGSFAVHHPGGGSLSSAVNAVEARLLRLPAHSETVRACLLCVLVLETAGNGI